MRIFYHMDVSVKWAHSVWGFPLELSNHCKIPVAIGEPITSVNIYNHKIVGRQLDL